MTNMDLNKIMELLDEPKGWLKISPADIMHLHDYCKQLIIENEQLRLHGVSKSFYCQSEIEMDGRCDEQCHHCKEYYKPLE